MKSADIAIVGSGSLAKGVVDALSQASAGSVRIAIVGRSWEKVLRLAHIGNARAAMFGTSTKFEALALRQFTMSGFARTFRALKPKVIFQVASLQSPWEAARGANGWTKLVESAGFGITLPLQMSLAAEVSRGADDSEAAIVNASYPDCVNVALHRLGLRTTCGIGNSAIVEAFCLSNTKSRDVRVVGHHGHLGGWIKGERSRAQPRIWVNGREMDAQRLRPRLGAIGAELNHVTASTAVPVIMALLIGDTLYRSIPGVAGLSGGYPFEVKHGKFKLQLPAGVSIEEALAHNKTGERLEGLDLASGVRFIGNARKRLASAGFEYAAGFDFAEWTCVRDRMLALRERLRQRIRT